MLDSIPTTIGTLMNDATLLSGDARILYFPREFNAERFERTKRLNGGYQCPKCELWWPCIEEPGVWRHQDDGKWLAIEWWGAAVCEDCEVLMVDQPDGTSECYRLREETSDV